MNYFLGIDLGTSYFKVGIFDETGHLKGLGRQYVHKVTDGAICELPLDVFWKTIRDCLDEALQMAGIPVNAIKSVSYSSQVNSFILLDKNNDPLTPLILWPDTRASGMELPVSDADELMKRTGLGITPNEQFTIAKLNWFKKHMPYLWEKVAFILSISDFLTFSLTGQKVCDYSTASMSGMFDIVNRTWWDEQLERFGIHADMLPLPQKIGAYVGTTTANASNLTGLPSGIPFCLGGLDHHMAAIGAGIPANGYINESTGTVLSCVDYTDSYFPQKNICTGRGLQAGSFFRMIFDENGAKSIEWYQKNYAPTYTIPELLEMAAKIEPDCEGLTAHPCAGAYLGLTGFVQAKNIHYQHGHYVRALLESTAQSLSGMIQKFKNSKNQKSWNIVSSGGGSRSALWVKIKSEILNASLHFGEGRGGAFLIPECTELSCMGAAMMGALGTNSFSNYNSMVDKWVRFKERI
jgi:sugar (pentulose or hexulose) kinase